MMLVSCLVVLALNNSLWLDGYVTSASDDNYLVDFSADADIHGLSGYYGGRIVSKSLCIKLEEMK